MNTFDIDRFTPLPGVSIIEASAGTGKTHSITEIVNKMIASGHCKIDEILILTFTKAATSELKDRIRIRLGESCQDAIESQNAREIETLSLAIEDFDQSFIQTIHGFCQRTLQEFSLDCNLNVDFEIAKDTAPFELECKHQIIRQIQKTIGEKPYLLPFCENLGFGDAAIENLLKINISEADLLALEQTVTQQSSTIDDALLQLKNTWLNDRATIKEQLLSPKSPIKKVKPYHLPWIESAFMQLDQFVEKGTYHHLLFHTIEAFQTSKLEAALKKKAVLPASDFFGSCSAFEEKMTDELQDVLRIVHDTQNERTRILNESEQKLRYDDLLIQLRNGLNLPGSTLPQKLRSRFKVALIDEFQDTDPIQFEILKTIFLPNSDTRDEVENSENSPLILIGDPKQAIYSFRGGDIFTYQSAKSLARQESFLATNWRSAPEVNHAVNYLLDLSGKAPFLFDWIDYAAVETAEKNTVKAIFRTKENKEHNISGLELVPLEKKDFPTIGSVENALVADVANLLSGEYCLKDIDNERQVGLADIAILVPSNEKAATIRHVLSEKGIPASISGGASVFSSVESREWLYILTAILSYKDSTLLKAALASQPFAYTADQITELGNNPSEWNKVSYSFSQANALWLSNSIGAALAFLRKNFSWIENLSIEQNAHRKLANHHHVMELILEYEREFSPTPETLLRWIKERIEKPDSSNEMELLKIDKQSDAITIITMHKSKGLQYPIVLIPFANSFNEKKAVQPPFSYHDENNQLRRIFHQSQITPEIQKQKITEANAEKLRVIYVAITRAEFLCKAYIREVDWANHPISHWLKKGEGGSSMHDILRDLPDYRSTGIRVTQIESLPDTAAFVAPVAPQDEESSPVTPVAPKVAPPCPASPRHWSFSSITHMSHQDHGLLSDEPITYIDPETVEVSPGERSIHTFDKGTQAGLMFHQLLEFVDFSCPHTWPTQVESSLRQYGYHVESWRDIILENIESIATVTLPFGQAIQLRELPEDSIFRETEFNFPMGFEADHYRSFQELFSEHLWSKELDYQLPEIHEAESVIRGYMKGVIDMWVEFDTQVYLLDWKSNYLGETCLDYSRETMLSSMNEHHYHFQYLIYLCALNRYLRLVRPDYNYERDFAGVAYIYLRGVQPCLPGSSGVFVEKPPTDILLTLEHCFSDFPTTANI